MFRIRVENLPPLPLLDAIPGGADLSVPAQVDPGNPVGMSVNRWGNGNEAPVDLSLVQERPELLAASQPVYPARLRETGVEGVVVVQLVVDTSGRAEPGSLRVMRSSNPGFDAAAVTAIRGALFRPGRVWGRAVRVLAQVPVAFRLHP